MKLFVDNVSPEMVAEYDPSNEIPLLGLRMYDQRKVRWICAAGHKWEAKIVTRAYAKSGCPKCVKIRTGAERRASVVTSLAARHPDIASEWHHDNERAINEISIYDKGKAFWLCPEGHKWRGSTVFRVVKKRNGLTACPKCKAASSQNNLRIVYPELSEQWHPDKNGSVRPEHVRPHTSDKYWWRCQFGHEWIEKVGHRVSHSSCPHCPRQCSETLRRSTGDFIRLATAVHGNYYDYDHSVYLTNKIKLTIKCPVHGVFDQKPVDHLCGKGCPRCRKRKITAIDPSIDRIFEAFMDFVNELIVYPNNADRATS